MIFPTSKYLNLTVYTYVSTYFGEGIVKAFKNWKCFDYVPETKENSHYSFFFVENLKMITKFDVKSNLLTSFSNRLFCPCYSTDSST